MLLYGKTAIITGCNRGIGKAILKQYAMNGATIFACARKSSEEFENYCLELQVSYSVKIIPIYFDLTNTEEIKAAIKKIMSEKMPIDILVNNAGITYNALFQMTTIDKWHEQFEVNYFAPMIFAQYVVKLMQRNKKGSIINISSSAGIDCNSGRFAYGSSKAAVISSTKTMAYELGASNIRVNSIAPGITDTDMARESMTEAVIQETVKDTSLKRMGRPDDIANGCVFLGSDLSSYVSGQVLRVDGGLN